MATKTPAAAPAPKLSMQELASQYGYAAAFFNGSPELQSLIQQAVSGQWTPDKFRAALMATTWYRSRTESQRQFAELSARDPNEGSKRITDKAREIQAQANAQGFEIENSRLVQMATEALSNGWDDELQKQFVAAEWHYQPNGGTSGGAATMETKVRQLADDYGVTVSDGQVADFIGGTMAGRYTEDNVADFMRDTARSKYPGLQGYLDSGMTVKQVASPYIQSYSTLLEQDADTVSLSDPHIQRALQGIPDKAGSPPVKAVSLYDFERDLRRDPRWLGTKNAKDQVQNSALGVLRDFGIYG